MGSFPSEIGRWIRGCFGVHTGVQILYSLLSRVIGIPLQHQAQRLASQRLQPPGTLSSTSGPPGSQSTQPPLQPQQGQQLPQQMGRFVNGITRPGFNYLTNGQTHNGIIPGIHGQHPQFQSGVSFSVGPPQSNQPQQPNGVPGGPGGPQQSAPGGVNPNQPMQFNSLMPGQQQQRQPPPLMNGHLQQQPQQRGPGPFQSPTMAHSPQNNAGTPGQLGPSNQPQQGQQQGQPPMGQFGGPSPNMAHAHMSRTDMLPPNGSMNPMNSAQQQQQLPQQPGGPPTPGYSQQQQQQQQGGGRPPSRTNTPAGMMHSSPSLASRQPPPGGMGPGGAVSESNINAEIMRIPQNVMLTLKRENGLADKDFATLTMPEKVRSLYFVSTVTFSYYIWVWTLLTRDFSSFALRAAYSKRIEAVYQGSETQIRNRITMRLLVHQQVSCNQANKDREVRLSRHSFLNSGINGTVHLPGKR